MMTNVQAGKAQLKEPERLIRRDFLSREQEELLEKPPHFSG